VGNILMMALCFAAGIILRRSGRLPASTPAVLNSYIINVALPALTLLHIHDLEYSPGLAYPAAMAWVLFVGGFFLFRQAGRVANLSAGTVGALFLTGGLGNTSFVGLPMIEAFYGTEYLGIGILIDQLGSFLVLSTIGIILAVSQSSGKTSPSVIARKILAFPPFIALLAAFALTPFPYPEWAGEVLGRLGATLPPIALLSVGFQLRVGKVRDKIGPLALGLFYKLLLGPALVAVLFILVLGAKGTTIQITIFEAATAPMITGGIVASEHGLDPDLSALMVGVGIPLSFLTLPCWWWILARF